MKKKYFSLIIIIIITSLYGEMFAQYNKPDKSLYKKKAFTRKRYSIKWKNWRREIILGAGATNFLGELGGANQIGTNGIRDFDLYATRPCFMLGAEFKLKEFLSFRNQLSLGYLNGNDKYTEEPFRKNRNLNFRTPIVEFSTQLAIFMTAEREGHRYRIKGLKGWKYINITSYVFAGFGLFYFNPQGYYNGSWHDLKPLSTEGEGIVSTRKQYSLIQPCIPIGIGIKRNVTRYWSVGLEFGIRKTWTDYIDDVSKTYVDPNLLRSTKGDLSANISNPNLGLKPGSTLPGLERGDPSQNDSYMFMMLTFTYKIPRGKTFPIIHI
ncbi:MAG: DUF6089 family protein [Bacteroidota bacterium]|nr:DUF6089 family protein [Bacteroidota bacterium]